MIISVTLTSLYLVHCLIVPTYSQLSKKAVQDILDYHNNVRSQIALGKYIVKFDNSTAGPASNMNKLTWDEEMAARAQEFSTTCPTTHSTGGYGENLYLIWWSDPIESIEPYGYWASRTWEKEFTDYGLPKIVFDDLTIGHATQLAWAESRKIGCGASFCDPHKVSVVCQYYPAGNFWFANIYEEGETCSKCPEGTKCETTTGLCV